MTSADCGSVSSGTWWDSGVVGIVDIRAKLLLWLAFGEATLIGDCSSEDGCTSPHGSSKKLDAGKISGLTGTIPVHLKQETAFSTVAALR